MSTRGQKGRGRGRPPERDIPKFYLVACELADDQPLTRAVKKVVQRVEPSPTYFDVNVRRIRRKFKKQRAEEWLTTIAKKYGWIDDYDPASASQMRRSPRQTLRKRAHYSSLKPE